MYSLVISDKNDRHEIQNDIEAGTHNARYTKVFRI